MLSIRDRKKKYSGNRSISKIDDKVDINFDLNALNLMCAYVTSENRNIRRSQLLNMRNLFDIIDLNLYQNDIEKMKRVNFIKKGLEARLLKNLNNPILVIKYINGGIMDDNVIDINNFTKLSNEELNWINETVSESLKYAFIYNDIDRIQDIITRFKAADYRSKGSIVREYQSMITETQAKFRRVKVEDQTQMMFTLRSGLFEENIKEIHSVLSNPSRKLKTGMQGFNELTGGGLEGGRVYMLLGMAGDGKSLSLLDLAYQMKKYNKGYKPKDPSKLPAIVILTMENDVKETVDRLVQMSIGGDMRSYDPDQLIDLLRTQGELTLNDDSPIDIIIKYMPDKSVDTGYLYDLTEDLEDEGYEVIAFIQDHIKRIRSCYPQTDIRLELGAVVNEFKTFAYMKDIPVITDSHLNREGARMIDEGARANKADLTRMLGRANVGESMLMIDNLDCAFIIHQEYDAAGNRYMAFKRIKMRYKATNRDLIFQPFTSSDSIKLVEDLYAQVPVCKDTLKASPEEANLYNTGMPKSRVDTYNNIKVLDNLDGNDMDDNIFSATRYRQSPVLNLDDYTNTNEKEPVVCGTASKPYRKQILRFVEEEIA